MFDYPRFREALVLLKRAAGQPASLLNPKAKSLNPKPEPQTLNLTPKP